MNFILEINLPRIKVYKINLHQHNIKIYKIVNNTEAHNIKNYCVINYSL